MDKSREDIERLCENMHMEKNANILIFLVHHSKDQGIIDEILTYASVIFDGQKLASLDKEDTKYLWDYIKTIPGLTLEQRNVDAERRKQLERKDNIDDIDEESEEPDEVNDQELLVEINRSVRIVEIIGQILRNRYGSLTKDQLTDLSEAAYTSGLRFLNFFLSMTRHNQKPILKFLQDIFKKNTNYTDNDISKEARKIFLMLCYGTSYSVIKKLANSLGSDKLIPVFQELSNKNLESPAFQLIFITIQLGSVDKLS